MASLASAALLNAASKSADTAQEAIHRTRTARDGGLQESERKTLLVALDQLARHSRTLRDKVSRALLAKDEQALGAALDQFESDCRGGVRFVAPGGCEPTDAEPGAVGLLPLRPETRARERDGAVMVLVPAGRFVRGAEGDEADVDEYPRKAVEAAGFWMERTEVSVEQYARCVEAKGCTRRKIGASCNVGPARAQHPVNCVSWVQASAYCAWAGARLPTEQEWEKAARGTDGRSYPWGEEPPDCQRAMWFEPKRGHGCGTHATAPVGSRPAGASPYGLLDMAGNVWEWVQDSYHPAWALPAVGEPRTSRVLRGGGWGKDGLGSLRASVRLRLEAGLATAGTGFRCAMDEPWP